MKKIIFLIIIILKVNLSFAQEQIILSAGPKAYIPNKKILNKYPLYSTINKYDFKEKIISLKFKDNRDSLNIKKTDCSDIEISNKTTFNSELGTKIVKFYIDSLFTEANFQIDKNSIDEIKIELNVLDGKKEGFLVPNVHGLCQLVFSYKGFTKSYCVDLIDGHPNAPVGRMTMITVKKASHLMMCASIRETIELFFIDFELYKEN